MITGRDRIITLLEKRETDRLPVMASFIAAGAYWENQPQSMIHRDAQFNAHTIINTSRALGLDGAYISSDNWIIHYDLGGETIFPIDEEPWGNGVVLDDWDKLDDLQVPNPYVSGRMSFMLSAASFAVKFNNGELFLEANIDSGPFMMACTLRGAQQLLLDLVDEPKKVHKLLEFCLEVASVYSQAMAKTGVDAIQFGESASSLINHKMFEEFVQPYSTKLIKEEALAK